MKNPFNITRESFDFYVPEGFVEALAWHTGKPVLLQLTKDVRNPTYDARTRYGLRAQEVIKAGTKLVHYPAQVDPETIKAVMEQDRSDWFGFFREGVIYDGTRKGQYIGYPNSDLYKQLLESSTEVKVETVSDWARVMGCYGDSGTASVVDTGVSLGYLSFNQGVDVLVNHIRLLYQEE